MRCRAACRVIIACAGAAGGLSLVKQLACLILLLSLGCKSWDKFWDTTSPTTTRSSLADNVNFAAANFQASIYASNSLWNDYINNDGTAVPVTLVSSPFTAGASATGQSTRLNASGVACVATQTGGYGRCIHAGIMRSFTISTLTSCTGLVVDDSLGAFHWICEKSTSGLRITSAGFKEGKYLTDLIDFAAVKFKAMSVTVTYLAQSVTSTPSVWWTNTVQNLVGTSYGVQSGIYLVQTNPISASVITPTADKTVLLVKPGVKITYTGSAAVINNSSRNFSWYEGTIDMAGSATTAISLALTNGNFLVVQNFGIMNSSPTGNSAYQLNCKNSYLRDIRYGNASIAAEKSLDFIASGDANLLTGVHTSNDMIPVTLNSTNNVVVGMTNANLGGGAGFAFDIQAGAISNYFQNLTIVNIPSGGIGAIRFNANGAQSNTWMNLGMGSSPSPAIHLGTGVPMNMDSQFLNLAAYVNTATIMNASASSYTYFGGALSVGNSGAASCGNALYSGFSVTCGLQDASDFTAISVVLDPTNSYVGKILVDDPINASDAGVAVTNYASITDWLKFSNPFRGYGLDIAAFPAAGNQGRCTGVNCRIWDWSLKATDAFYRNVLPVPTGSSVASHKWSAVAQVNCTQPGAQWVSGGVCTKPPFPGTGATCTPAGGTLTGAACLTTFLRNAYEILEDGIGNDNGLCESNEACIYTPNIASYQGHGNLTCVRGPADLGCASTFTNGTISNVVLYQYATNGY